MKDGFPLELEQLLRPKLSPDDNSFLTASRRRFLHAAGLLIADAMLPEVSAARSRTRRGSGQKVVMAIIGGIRREESFSPEGLQHIPHLVGLGKALGALRLLPLVLLPFVWALVPESVLVPVSVDLPV